MIAAGSRGTIESVSMSTVDLGKPVKLLDNKPTHAYQADFLRNSLVQFLQEGAPGLGDGIRMSHGRDLRRSGRKAYSICVLRERDALAANRARLSSRNHGNTCLPSPEATAGANSLSVKDCPLGLIADSPCQLLRERNSDSETILAIMQFLISDQPVPIKVCEGEGQPRKALNNSHIQVRFIEGGKQNLRRVVPDSSPAMKVSEAGIA